MEDSDLDKSNHGFPHPTQQTFDDINLVEIHDDIHSAPNYPQYHRAAHLIRDEDEHNNNSHHRGGLRRKGSFIGRHNASGMIDVEDNSMGTVTQQQQFLHQSSFFLDNDCVPRSGFAPKTTLQEMIAGMVVALATIPTSISYAAVVGISPTMGIWNSAILGLSSSVIGGAPGMITGAAGAAALPMSHIYKTHGLSWMTAAVLTASLIELIFGFSKLSRVADVVTEPVVTGFFNALSMFIVRSQVIVFQDDQGQWLSLSILISSIFTACLCMSIIICLHPWKHRFLLPLPLLGISLSSILVFLLQVPVLSLADFTKQHGHQFHGGWESLPIFVPFPSEIPWSLETMMTIFPGALGMSTVAIMETMVTQKVIVETMRKEMKKEYRQRLKQEEKERKREQAREREREQKRLHGTDEEDGRRGLEEREQRGDNDESDNESENSEDTDGGFEDDDDESVRENGKGMHDVHHYERVDDSVDEDNTFPPLHSLDSYDGDKLDDKRLRISLSSPRVHDDNVAIIGVGIGTFMTAMFGGFGGCPLLPKTILNIVTGGRSAISTASYAFSLMAMILFCGPLIGCIPMASLTGVMLSIAYETVRWKESWRLIEQSPKSIQACLNAIAMLLTSYLSFAVDMGLGVIVGVFVVKLPAIYGWCSESCCSSMRLAPKIASS